MTTRLPRAWYASDHQSLCNKQNCTFALQNNNFIYKDRDNTVTNFREHLRAFGKPIKITLCVFAFNCSMEVIRTTSILHEPNELFVSCLNCPKIQSNIIIIEIRESKACVSGIKCENVADPICSSYTFQRASGKKGDGKMSAHPRLCLFLHPVL